MSARLYERLRSASDDLLQLARRRIANEACWRAYGPDVEEVERILMATVSAQTDLLDEDMQDAVRRYGADDETIDEASKIVAEHPTAHATLDELLEAHVPDYRSTETRDVAALMFVSRIASGEVPVGTQADLQPVIDVAAAVLGIDAAGQQDTLQMLLRYDAAASDDVPYPAEAVDEFLDSLFSDFTGMMLAGGEHRLDDEHEMWELLRRVSAGEMHHDVEQWMIMLDSDSAPPRLPAVTVFDGADIEDELSKAAAYLHGLDTFKRELEHAADTLIDRARSELLERARAHFSRLKIPAMRLDVPLPITDAVRSEFHVTFGDELARIFTLTNLGVDVAGMQQALVADIVSQRADIALSELASSEDDDTHSLGES